MKTWLAVIVAVAWSGVVLAELESGTATGVTISVKAKAPPKPTEMGRLEVVVVDEGDAGGVVLLLDTAEGATWIYRPPGGPMINGHWSDIPRLTYPPELWRAAARQALPEDKGAIAEAAAATAPPANQPEVGRFRIVVAKQGKQRPIVFLVDTKGQATWIYRPPIGPAMNGYWSDIPRLTYPPEYWQRAFAGLIQAKQPQENPVLPQ